MLNGLGDLNNHLFRQLERLNDEDLKDPKVIEAEVERSKAIIGVSREVISNARLVLDASKAVGDGLIKKTPAMLGLDKK